MDDNARGDERIGSLGGSFEARAGSSRELAGVYLHVPFCSAICPYCDFAVTTGSRRARQEFAATLLEEIRLHEWFREPADTIYLGGGTPSALDDDALAAILDTLRATLAISSDAIVSLEANPEDVERARLDRWKSLGVSTVSLGVQSFKDEELRFLARRHDALRARESVELALEAGFRTVSVDLIFGLPGQRRSALDGNLDEIAALAPHHVSLYQLTIHSETPFARYRDTGKLVELGEDEQAELYLRVHERLLESGYRAYEVSNFARTPEHRSRHNRKYWRHVPYLGIGPSAASFHERERWWNERDLATWSERVHQGKAPIAGRDRLGADDLVLETVMLRLRTIEGLDTRELRERYGVDLVEANRARIERFERDGLIVVDGERIAPTPRGLALADGIARELELPPAASGSERGIGS